MILSYSYHLYHVHIDIWRFTASIVDFEQKRKKMRFGSQDTDWVSSAELQNRTLQKCDCQKDSWPTLDIGEGLLLSSLNIAQIEGAEVD